MLTRRGWLLLGGALAVAVVGRLLAIVELFAVAAALFALPVVGLASVRLTRFSLEASREVRPARVHAGSDSRVELAVRNAAARRSPVLAARDPFDGGRRWARFLLAPLAPGETARAAYRLPTEQRGIFGLGPLEIQLGDPFGTAVSAIEAAPETSLTVFPRVDPIVALPHTLGQDPHAGADHANALSLRGEDFYALREYVVGDDLRRVHWRSTAKTGELMIRQEEMPWQGRATVLLDLRRGVHNAESVELAVSAAASIVTASWKRRFLIRLVATDGVDSGFAAGHAHVETILEHLAEAQPERTSRLSRVLANLRHDGNGGVLAVITTAAAAAGDLEAIAELRGRFGAVVLVLFERSSFDPAAARMGAPLRAAPPVSTLVRVTAEQPFKEAWDRALAPRVGAAR